jgi:hypothetical protein
MDFMTDFQEYGIIKLFFCNSDFAKDTTSLLTLTLSAKYLTLATC